ncbi:MAG: hypothetical protein ACYTFG_20960, partial [Planctomycetota bacterium]
MTLEALGGWALTRDSLGWESGPLGLSRIGLSLHPLSDRSTRLSFHANHRGECGPSTLIARQSLSGVYGRSLGNGWKITTEVGGGAAEGAEPFRDFRRFLARWEIEDEVRPFSLTLDAGYEFAYDDLHRIDGSEGLHSAHVGALIYFSLRPLFLLQCSAGGEFLHSNLEGESRR